MLFGGFASTGDATENGQGKNSQKRAFLGLPGFCPGSARVLPKNHSQQLPKMALPQMITVRSPPLKLMLFIRAIGDKEVIAARKKPTFLILLQ